MNAEEAYMFRHALLRDVAYHLQLPSDRARRHALALECLEAAAGIPSGSEDRPHAADGFAREMADHARLSGLEELVPVRRLCLLRAALHAERHFQSADAARTWNELAGIESGDPRARALLRAGLATLQAGKVRESEQLYAGALAEAERAGATARIVEIRTHVAGMLRSSGRLDEAARVAALAAADGTSVHARNVHSLLQLDGGRVREAEAGFRSALRQARSARDRRGEAMSLDNLSAVWMQTGRMREALGATRGMLRIARARGERRWESAALGNIALLHRKAGRLREAEASLRRALALGRRIGDRRGAGILLTNLGALHFDAGRREEAERTYREALAIKRELMDRQGESVDLGDLALVLSEAGRLEEALPLLREALAISCDLGNRRLEAIQSCTLGKVLVGLGRIAPGRRAWRAGLEALRDLGDELELEGAVAEMRAVCAGRGLRPVEVRRPAPARPC